MSSLNRVQARVATTVAVRAAPVNKAISPKNSPASSRRGSGLSSISTSPAAMKYMQSPGSPRRTIVAPTGKSRGPQKPRDLGYRRGPDHRKKRHLGDDIPGPQEGVPADLLREGGGEDARHQRQHDDAANHHDTGQRPPR